jgi:RNA polymerase sigma factor (TIGR02999 family)
MVTAPQGPENPQGKPAREVRQFDSLYADLRLLARRQLRRERAGVSWSPTDLAHEAWVRLGGPADACDRVAFLRMAAVVMRNLLTDRARRLIRLRQRYPELAARGEWVSVNLGQAAFSVVELDDAFRRLAELDERKAQAAVLLGLVGCTQEQAAEALNVSLATLKRDWAFGSAWLRRALAPDPQP